MHDASQAHANARYRHICQAHPELLTIAPRARRILDANMRFELKSLKFYALADEMAALVAPYVVCRSGCSHCCYMPTMIWQHEAEAMAKVAYRPARQLSYRPIAVALGETTVLIGQACPFLVEGRCSIYAHRPLVCRLHNSLNDDPEDCRMGPQGTCRPVSSVDADWVEMPYLYSVLRWNPREAYGAIQEFFPDR